ncbi:hypothetical protein Sjap_022063 [Stephania japonica]|uniref:Uncharacterized protein n=1 Tax=Stephania japonica TaxID=461633 RepID=A0AAP0ENL8_9MAGN
MGVDVKGIIVFWRRCYGIEVQIAELICGIEATGEGSSVIVPSPVQSHAWPFLLDSRDLFGIAKIGLAYWGRGIFNVILIPCKIADVLCEAGKSFGVKSICLFGGSSKGPHIQGLKSMFTKALRRCRKGVPLDTVFIHPSVIEMLDSAAEDAIKCRHLFKIRLYCNHEEEVASISDEEMLDGDDNIDDKEMVDGDTKIEDEEMVDANIDHEEMVVANIDDKDEKMVDANIHDEEMVEHGT